MTAPAEQPLLHVAGLRTYIETRGGTVRAVDGVDLEVQAGRTLCVVGESGCGKSLTALSIMGLLAPSARIMPGSQILFGGANLATVPRRQLENLRGSHIAMIFQDPMSSLNPLFSVGSQIVETIRRHRGGGRKEAWARAIELLDLVGIPSPQRRAHHYPHQLSGGLRQRSMIAMALSCDPQLLIADEPTTALDVTIQAQILELLRELQSRLGMAIMLITHDFGVVAEIADTVAVMYAGQVVERGPAAGMLASPSHPYAEALIASVPVLGMPRDVPLRVIPGHVPSPKNWPEGCRFRPRCGQAFAPCAHTPPPFFATGELREAACWLRDPSRAGQSAPAEEALS
ncbi:MAG: ABC transporter ATP-binding protein [Streptosporangiaceae bacterium]